MRNLCIGLWISFAILLIAFIVTYYTNDLLLEQNEKLFERLQACEGNTEEHMR
jgi:hypothetical protein